MHDIILYLESQASPQELLLIMGDASGIEIMTDIFKGLNTKKITVCATTTQLYKSLQNMLEEAADNPDLHIPEEIILLLTKDLKDYKKCSDEFAIIFTGIIDYRLITPLASLTPQYLLGICNNNYLKSFDIWENFREHTEQIYLVSYTPGNNTEVLTWTRNPQSEVELSVIFPMYNVAEYLPQCIKSATAWEAEYIEYLFVDDGSPDNCSEIVLQYAKKDPRIKLLRKKNGGCASARQYGLDHATGRYVGFIDPDDFIEPEMYRKLLSRALTGSYEISYCGYHKYYENTNTSLEISDALSPLYCQGTSDPQKINELISYLRVAIWRGIYSRSLITRNRIHFYTDLRRFDDLPFKVEVFSKARSVVAVPEYLYYYRLSRPGQDVSADDDRLYVHFPIFDHLDDSIRKSSDRRQLDYLQLVKVHTHRYALEKIKKEFSREYCKQAKKDIRSNFGLIEGAYIIRKLGSKSDLLFYMLLYFGCNNLIRRTSHRKVRHDTKNEKAVKKLNLLNTKEI